MTWQYLSSVTSFEHLMHSLPYQSAMEIKWETKAKILEGSSRYKKWVFRQMVLLTQYLRNWRESPLWSESYLVNDLGILSPHKNSYPIIHPKLPYSPLLTQQIFILNPETSGVITGPTKSPWGCAKQEAREGSRILDVGQGMRGRGSSCRSRSVKRE